MQEESLSILVAEDQELTRAELKMVLGSFSDLSLIGEACDGQAAVSECLRLAPAVVVMDITMPHTNGIQATKQIKRLSPSTKVIIFSSYSRDEDVFAAIAAGADGYCLKDATPDQFHNAIRTVACGAAWLHPNVRDRVLARLLPKCRESFKNIDNSGSRRDLSPRESQVLQLLVEGLTNSQIAVRLNVTGETVKSHMRHIMDKLGVSDRTQAAVRALRDELV